MLRRSPIARSISRIMKFLRPILATLTLLAGTALASDQLLNSLKKRDNQLVYDHAQVIPEAQERQLDSLLLGLMRQTGDTVVVVTLPSLEGGQIDDFSIRLAERWGISQKGKDNGILLLGATQEPRGNRLRIEVGYGLEGIINDAKAGRILDNYVVPAWNQKQYGTAIVSGGTAIARELASARGIKLSGAPQYANYSRGSGTPRKTNPIIKIIFIIGFIYMAIRHPRLLIFLMLTSGRGGSRGGGGFGGGGFGGFGGGGFGGGGASR